MKKSEPKVTLKQQALAELLACDYNIPEAAVVLGISRRALEGIANRLKDKLEVKYLHGIVGEADRLGIINNKELRKRERQPALTPKTPKT